MAGGSPQADLRPGRLPTDIFRYIHMCGTREDAPTDYHYIHMFNGFQTEIHVKPRASHKQKYDQGGSPPAELRPGSPQAELRPGSLLAGWLAGSGDYDQETCHALGWLAGWLGGWLAGRLRPREAQRGPERPREAQRCGAWIERACHAGILRGVGWEIADMTRPGCKATVMHIRAQLCRPSSA